MLAKGREVKPGSKNNCVGDTASSPVNLHTKLFLWTRHRVGWDLRKILYEESPFARATPLSSGDAKSRPWS
ncbi:hypothetical protein RRG08_048865 [Elysia crispata]|uniref:Uncharacterized protein n=1 Tax=Elysia crispata TaxID=231223 RepID=A0AAE0ZFY3_9GAST|nr:hypothetical protein RRG08_048865 [Elysia crispata]